MNAKYLDTGKSRLEVLIDELKTRNAFLPDLGYNFGLYVYTPWKPIYELKPYDTQDKEFYEVFYTANYMQSLFPHARIHPPVMPFRHHCCIIRDNDIGNGTRPGSV